MNYFQVKTLVAKLTKKLDLEDIFVIPPVPYPISFTTHYFGRCVIFIRKVWKSEKESVRDIVLHEIGHVHFFTYHGGSVMKKKEFREVFGNPNKAWPKTSWKGDLFETFGLTDWQDSYQDDPRYISKYAQTHPWEDYAETFVRAWQEVEGGKEKHFANPELRKKIKTVKRWIRETMVD